MNPSTLSFALRIAKQARNAQKERAQRKQREHFDALDAMRNTVVTDEQREAMLRDSPAHIRAVAEQLRKQDGAAAALDKARTLHAAHVAATAEEAGNTPTSRFANPLETSAEQARDEAKSFVSGPFGRGF